MCVRVCVFLGEGRLEIESLYVYAPVFSGRFVCVCVRVVVF